MPWKTFLKSHFGEIAAADFFTVEVLTLVGLVRYHVQFVIDLETRRVEIVGIDCVFRSHLGTDSGNTWALVPETLGH